MWPGAHSIQGSARVSQQRPGPSRGAFTPRAFRVLDASVDGIVEALIHTAVVGVAGPAPSLAPGERG